MGWGLFQFDLDIELFDLIASDRTTASLFDLKSQTLKIFNDYETFSAEFTGGRLEVGNLKLLLGICFWRKGRE